MNAARTRAVILPFPVRRHVPAPWWRRLVRYLRYGRRAA